MFAIVNGEEIPEYYGKPYIKICDNIPNFNEFPKRKEYRRLGSYKRCGKEHIIYSAYDCIKWICSSEEKSRPNNKRISKYYPDQYNFIKGDGYLFNYCHLIAHQFLEEDSDKRNFVVGTRYMNERGMAPLENEVRVYLEKKPRNHVLYRVTPIWIEGDQLVKGVQMEAYSVEDNGEGICFNKFVYNAQPGVAINYKEGKSKEDKEWHEKLFPNKIYTDEKKVYILNIATHKFHKRDCIESICNEAENIGENNKREIECPRKYLIDNGYKPCENCKP